VAIGATYHWVSILILGFLAVNDPVQTFLLDTLVRQERHVAAYQVLSSLHHVILSLLVALPFAAAFRLIPALRSWIYVGLAAAVAVIAVYANMVWGELPTLIRLWQFWFGLLVVAMSLPAAFAIVNRSRFGSTTPGAAQVPPNNRMQRTGSP
jgi:hypothetical protein